MATEQVDQLEPFTEQEPFLGDSKRYYGYISGVGAGKTAIGVMRDALNMELWNPGYMGAIVAPTTQMIKNAILPLMREFGLMRRWEYKGPQAEMPGIQSPNGSRAVILSANNERQIERLASMNLAWWHLDESKDIDPRARQILIQRLRDGDYANGCVTTTPKGKNHDYDFFVGDHDPEEYEYGEATVFETDDRLSITGVPTDANPHLDREDVQAIRDAHPSGLLQQEVEGKFVEIGAGIFTHDMLSFCSQDDLKDDWSTQWLMSVDPATQADSNVAESSDSDYWAATLCLKHRTGLYPVDSIRERGMTLKQGVSWVSRISNTVPNPKVFVESNQSQRWLKQELKAQGVNAVAVNSTQNKEERIIDLSIPIENGTIKFVNHPPQNATEAELEAWEKEKQNLGYDPRWKELVNELLAFPEGNHDDLIDSLHLCVDNAGIGANTSILGAGNRGEDNGST